MLSRDCLKFANIVNNNCYNINQNQFDALVSFAYNLGNVNGIKDKVNDGSLTRDDFLAYVYAGGVKYKGLENRRNAEADLYFKPESLVMSLKRVVSMLY